MKNIQYIILITLFISITSSCNKTDDTNSENLETAVKIGALAPEFELTDPQGNFHKLSDYRGTYIVVDFWAAWCGICRRENPKMQALHLKYQNKNLVIIGLSLDKTKEAWLQAIEDDQLTYIQLGDQEAFQSKVAKTYGVTGIPFMMLLNLL